jgi:hypothetical protein
MATIGWLWYQLVAVKFLIIWRCVCGVIGVGVDRER